MNYETELWKLHLLAKACRAAQRLYFANCTRDSLVIAKAAENKLDEALLRLAIALEVEDHAEEINLLE